MFYMLDGNRFQRKQCENSHARQEKWWSKHMEFGIRYRFSRIFLPEKWIYYEKYCECRWCLSHLEFRGENILLHVNKTIDEKWFIVMQRSNINFGWRKCNRNICVRWKQMNRWRTVNAKWYSIILVWCKHFTPFNVSSREEFEIFYIL